MHYLVRGKLESEIGTIYKNEKKKIKSSNISMLQWTLNIILKVGMKGKYLESINHI